MAFIDDMRAEGHAVESTCRVLREQGCPVAARTYRAWRRGRPPADRTVSDAVIMDAILATAGTPEELYGRRKMTHHLRRAGHQVAFCTVDRIMAELGRNGIRRGKALRTTIPGKDADRPGDLLNRQFRAEAPNRIWVADFTYLRTWGGFSYVAFIVDVFAQRIVARHRQAHRPGPHSAADRAMGPAPRWPPRSARPAGASQRRRQPIHLDPLHRAPDPGRYRALGRDGR